MITPQLQRYSNVDFDTMRRVATTYWGDRGDFAYRAYAWANESLYEGRVPVPLIQWALTPHGQCLGSASLDPSHPVITLHPAIWGSGALEMDFKWNAWGGIFAGQLYTLDVVIHEMLHLLCAVRLCESVKGYWKSSHDNFLWPVEVQRVSPMIGLPGVIASRMKRKRIDGRMATVPQVEGSISMDALSRWPGSLRAEEYYRETSLPFEL